MPQNVATPSFKDVQKFMADEVIPTLAVCKVQNPEDIEVGEYCTVISYADQTLTSTITTTKGGYPEGTVHIDDVSVHKDIDGPMYDGKPEVVRTSGTVATVNATQEIFNNDECRIQTHYDTGYIPKDPTRNKSLRVEEILRRLAIGAFECEYDLSVTLNGATNLLRADVDDS